MRFMPGSACLRRQRRLGTSVTELRAAIPPMLNTPEMRFQVDETRKFAAMDEIAARLTTNPGAGVESVNAHRWRAG